MIHDEDMDWQETNSSLINRKLSIEQIAGLKQRVKVENGDKEKSGFEWRKILEWCNSHSDVPDDEDQVFCVDIDYELMKAKKSEFLKYFRVFCTTKRLLSLATIKSKYIFFTLFSFLFYSYVTTHNGRRNI